MDRGAGRENKQHLFPIEAEKVSTLPYLDQGHGVTTVSGGGAVVIVQFVCLFVFFSPRQAGDKTVAVEGSKGRVPGSQTQTHTKKHFISITNHRVGNMNVLKHKIQIHSERMSFVVEYKEKQQGKKTSNYSHFIFLCNFLMSHSNVKKDG